MSSLQSAIAAADRPIRHDLASEELLLAALYPLAQLSTERPGGVQVAELAKRLGFDARRLAEALDRGRHGTTTRDGSATRGAVVERVRNDLSDCTRARYVLTALGRSLASIDLA